MKTRTKKMLSLLLATAMVFTMNTFAFAEEVADVDSFAEEISFADVEEVPTAYIYADTTTPTTATTSPVPGFTTSEVQAMSENKPGRPVSVDKIGGVDGLTLSYNSLIPFFGKKIPKNSEGKVLGEFGKEVVVSYKGKPIAIKKAQVVYWTGKGSEVKDKQGGAFPTVSNAGIVITLDNKALKTVVTDKATQKAIKKAFKDKSVKATKKSLGAFKVIVYPYRLRSASKPVLKGKKATPAKIKLIVDVFGKNFTMKSGKDTFVKKGGPAFEIKNDKFSVSNNDVWSGDVGVSENGIELSKFDTGKLK